MRTAVGMLVVGAVLVGGCGGKGGGGGAPSPTPTAPAGFCSAGGWCYQNPLPQGEALLAVSVLGDGTAFAAGEGGEVLRYDGKAWAANASLGAGKVKAVRAFAANDVIAAGDDGVWRWDGASWTQDGAFPAAQGTGIWASGPDDVWVVGANGGWPIVRRQLSGLWRNDDVWVEMQPI